VPRLGCVRKSLNLLGDLRVRRAAAGSLKPSAARPTTCAVAAAFAGDPQFLVKNAPLKSGQVLGR